MLNNCMVQSCVDEQNCWSIFGYSALLVSSWNKDGLIQGLQIRLGGEMDPKRKYRWLSSRGRNPRCPQLVLDMNKLVNFHVCEVLEKYYVLVHSIPGIKVCSMDWNMSFKEINNFYVARNNA